MSKSQTGLGLIYVVILLVVVAAVAVGAYYFGTKNSSQVPSAATPVPTLKTIINSSLPPSPTPVSSASASPSTSLMLLENIKAAVVSKNTAALEGYMTDQVNVIIEATECCGILTKANAIKEMDYLNTATLPWNFDDNNPIAAELRAKNPTAFPEGIILGTSGNRMLVTFTLNADRTKIEKVYMAIDYKLHGI